MPWTAFTSLAVNPDDHIDTVAERMGTLVLEDPRGMVRERNTA
jgi:hypothetical protein